MKIWRFFPEAFRLLPLKSLTLAPLIATMSPAEKLHLLQASSPQKVATILAVVSANYMFNLYFIDPSLSFIWSFIPISTTTAATSTTLFD